MSHSVVTGWASYGRDYLGAFVPAAQHDFGIGDPVIGGEPSLKQAGIDPVGEFV